MVRNRISIIVPAHNVEKYLDKCMISLLEQTYKDIELIIVNDHSEDRTYDMLKKWQKKDKRIKLFDSTERGVSAARNFGLDHATGEFIMFCDSDDYYEPTTCEDMISTIQSTNADIAISELKYVYQTHQEKRLDDELYSSLQYSGVKRTSEIEIPEINVFPVNKIFRKENIDLYNIRFPIGRYYEDAYFSFAYLYSCNTVAFLHKRLYNYIRREGSTMSITWSVKDAKDTSIDHVYVIIELYKFLKKNNLLDQHLQSFWLLFFLYESRALVDCKSKNSRRQILQLVQDFLAQHKDDFNRANNSIKSRIIYLVPRLRWTNLSTLKRLLLHFLPTYRMQIQNMEDLTMLVKSNRVLLNQLNQILKKVEK